MSLTGTPLITLAILATAAALAATILIWTRGRRLRFLLRSLGVLLTEALLLLSVGLVVNRSQQFYPTWAALLQTAGTTGTTFATKPGNLDRWLRTRAGTHLDQSVAFTWQPSGWTGWHLAEAPTIVTPTGYLQHPGWLYPALLVIDDGAGGWTPTIEAAAARDAGAAVIVFARTTSATTANTLATTLPTALARDLRVTGRRWAVVAGASDAGLAQQTVAAAPGLYPAIALVQGTVSQDTPNAKPTTHASAALGSVTVVTARQRPRRPGGAAAAALQPMPAGITLAIVGAPAAVHPAAPGASTVTPAGYRGPAAASVYLAAEPANGLQTALVWACQQTPPPLAASTPAATYVPIQHRSQHHLRHRTPTGRPPGSALAGLLRAIIPGGSHVPGQPGH